MICVRPQPRATTESMLFAIMAFVFVAYLVVGLAMPVLPLYVRDNLDLNTVVVGLVAGSPFAAALLSRFVAGRYTDARGAKPSIVLGLLVATLGGLFYVLSARVNPAGASVAVLLLGRLCLGAADSFIITGALSWGLALLGVRNTGKVMAWVGTALYAAFAIGAPIGTAIYSAYGFLAVAIATILIPLCALLALASIRVPSAPMRSERASTLSVVRVVWQPGVALAFSGVGFGANMAFIGLLFSDHRWMPIWSAFTALSLAFIIGRLILGGLPDRVGGAKVAFACVLLEAAGLALIWLAPTELVALAGVALSGLGYSLVYPALGVEALRHAPSMSRGLAMGTYTAFLDLSLGVSGPLLGMISDRAGLNAIFLASAIIVMLSAAIPMRLWLRHGG